MKKMKIGYFGVVMNLVIIGFCFTDAQSMNDVGSLIKNLTDPDVYNRRVIPKTPDGKAVNVRVGVVIEQVNDLNDRKQELHWAGFVRVVWNDPLLAWEPSEWGGQAHLFLREEDIWVPDICILERLDDDIGFKEQKRRLLYVNHKGDIKFVLGGDLIVTRCPLNIYKFPFDRQTCSMLVGSYSIPRKDLQLVDPKQSGYSPIAAQNALWEVIGTESNMINFTYVNDLGTMIFDYLRFEIHFRRKSTYFVVNIIAPLVLMSGLMIVTFYIPPGSGEKVGFGITLLLALNVIQLVITDNMPHTSESFPIVSVYVTLLLAMSALLIPLSILTIFVSRNGYSFFPKCLQRLLYKPQHSDTNGVYATTNSNFLDDSGIKTDDLKTMSLDGCNNESQNDWDKMKVEVIRHVTVENERRRLKMAREKHESEERERFENVATKIDMFCMKLFGFSLVALTIACAIAIFV